MHKLIDAALHHQRTVLMVLVLLLISGVSSYLSIPKESAPDVPIPTLYISMQYDGISPEDSVNLLVKPMELELRDVEGLDEMQSTAYEGGGNVVLNFTAGFDSDEALADVREKVDLAKAELPQAEEAEEPRVNEVNVSLFPILTIMLAGDVREQAMKQIAEDLQDALENVSGVLEVDLIGLREDMVLIEVDRTRLQAYGVTPTQITQAIGQNNLLVAAGSLQLATGQYAVKIPGLFRSREEILSLPLITDGDRVVRVRDVAEVTMAFKDAETINRVNGQPAVTLQVKKRIGENVIGTVDAVKAKIDEIRPTWPENLQVSYTSDESANIRSMLNDLQNNVAIAVLLVMIVILAALGYRSAALVALTVPGSFLTAVLILSMMDVTMNIVVLFALILAVGMLVDGAIVVTEQADQNLAKGEKKITAFGNAAKVMAWPITASTATTLAAFLPLLFWPDTVGEFMKYLPLTLIFTLSASLAMALIFLPVLGSLLPGGKEQNPDAKPQAGRITQGYEDILRWCLDRPWQVFAGVVVTFFLVIGLYSRFGAGVEFFPAVEPERANLVVHARGDYSITKKDIMMREIETRMAGLPGVEVMNTGTGVNPGLDTGPSDVIGTIFLEYEDWEVRGPQGWTSQKILAEAKSRVTDLYGIRLETQEQEEGPSDGKPIQILITADEFADIPPIVNELKQRLNDFSGTENIDDNLPEPGIEWQLAVDRTKAAKEGTNLAEVGALLRLGTTGAIVGTYRPQDRKEEIDIVARFKADQRDLTTLTQLQINAANGPVPLVHFVTREAQPKVTVIRRTDQKTSATVEADVGPGVLAADVVAAMKEEVKTVELPPGVSIEFQGEDEDQREAGQFLMQAFGVALFIMAIILVTQFNSYYQALLILSAVILSTAGVLLGHLILGKPFGIVMSGVGVIALAGIVVNNNIVLIDQFNRSRRELGDWYEALIETGKSRLRPVMLTAGTTVIGLLGMASKVNIDLINREISYNAPSSQWWDQLASSIIFGLSFATVLTLIVTPCLLAIACRKGERKAS